MDISTHSTASSSAAGGGGGNAPQQQSAASSTATNNNNNNRKPPTTTSREQSQLVKLREANSKYKNLLKLAKERIQEQEGVLDERRCEYLLSMICFCSVVLDGSHLYLYFWFIVCLVTDHNLY